MLIMLSFANRGEICSPETVCSVYSDRQTLPLQLTIWQVGLVLTRSLTYQASLYRKLAPIHQQFIDVVRAISHSPSSPD